MMRSVLIASLVLSSSLVAQTALPDTSSSVTLITSPVGADVYVDSVFVGKSPLHGLPVSTGHHVFRMYYPSLFAWNAVLTQDSVDVAIGEHVEKRVSVGEVLLVDSHPSGGSVWYDSSLVGVTPLYLRSQDSLRGSLTIKKEGYDSLEVPLRKRDDERIRVQLNPLNALSVSGQSTDLLPSNGTGVTDHWLTYASGATMIAAGVASAYLKDRANRQFDLYTLTNDPSSLSKSRTLDRAAAATLILSTVSFGILSYLLLSE